MQPSPFDYLKGKIKQSEIQEPLGKERSIQTSFTILQTDMQIFFFCVASCRIFFVVYFLITDNSQSTNFNILYKILDAHSNC